jgi:hypothetical protein
MKWLRWLLVCRRGRLCAQIQVSNLRGPFRPPPDYGLVLRWKCEACGRTYERKVTMEEIYEGEQLPA